VLSQHLSVEFLVNYALERSNHQLRSILVVGAYCRTPAEVSLRIRDVSLFRFLFFILLAISDEFPQFLVG
jgi:hypothetical protein